MFASRKLVSALIASRLVPACAAFLLMSGACVTAIPSGPPASRAAAPTPTSPAATPAATPRSTSITVLDGEPWIVYTWPRVATDGTWAMYLMRPDGSDAHEIAAETPGEHRAPAWSPDGRQLAFVVRGGDYPEGSIWTAKADGSDAALLSAGGETCPVGLFHPAWSPDGTKLALVCYPGGDDHESVAVLDLATRSITRLADFTHPDAVDSAPTWSPDGGTIAFEVLHYDPTMTDVVASEVATVPAAGGKIRRLTSPDLFMGHPDWRPDGTELVMNNGGPAAGPGNLYVIKPDGSGLQQLTTVSVDGHVRIETPRWAPDGARILVSILYTTGPDFAFAGEVRLAIVDGAGGEPGLISTLSGKYPDLRPT